MNSLKRNIAFPQDDVQHRFLPFVDICKFSRVKTVPVYTIGRLDDLSIPDLQVVDTPLC